MTTERKTRRPIGHRDEPDGPEPQTNVRTFLYKEDADTWAEAAKLCGWVTYTQYVGAWMRWVVEARRASWAGNRRAFILKDGSIGSMVEQETK